MYSINNKGLNIWSADMSEQKKAMIYPCGKNAAVNNEHPRSTSEEFFNPLDVLKELPKWDEEYDKFINTHVRSETTKKILKTSTVKAVAYLSGAATAMGASIVASAAANDGTPIFFGLMAAIPLTVKSLHSATNTKLVKAFAHGIKNFSKTVYRELAPEGKAIITKLKKFKQAAQQRIENFKKGMVIVRPGPEGVNGKGTVVEKDINNNGNFVKIPRILHRFFINKNKGK